MQRSRNLWIFALFVAFAAGFVWHTSQALPSRVASHFGASGLANGYMPHTFYLRFMTGFVIGFPASMVAVTWHILGHPEARINLPNKDYWLAPERRATTIAYLRNTLIWFGGLLLTFLCHVHWLVVEANTLQPPRLAESGLFVGLLAFFTALIIWLMRLLGHFRARP